ncbi:MAG: tetratricopeptide repeat protein, partial [Elusimicrobia bacterium]|nr:tetratricopeptide repeat protein [Elusimicrobiota bacterium]
MHIFFIFLFLTSGDSLWAKEARSSDAEARAWKILQAESPQSSSASETLNLLNKFIRSYPQGEHVPDARFAIAETLFREGQYKKALPQYQLLLEQENPAYMDDASLRLGEISYNTGDLVQARKFWEKLTGRIFGRSLLVAEAMYGLALCELYEKNFLGANQILERTIHKFPSYGNLAKVRELLGILRFQEKNFRQAVEVLEGLSTPSAAFYRGLSYFHQKQYLEAASSFNELTAMTSGTYAELGAYFKAECFRMARNDTLAVRAYDEFTRQYPQSKFRVYALIHQARALDRLGKRTEAMRGLAIAKQTGGSKEIRAYAMYLEAEISAKMGQVKTAIEILDRALELASREQPDLYASIHVAKVYYLLQTGRSREAPAVMQELVQALPYHPLGMLAYILLGNEAHSRNDWKTAISSYESALLKYQYSPLSDVAMGMMLSTYFQGQRYQELVTNANRVMKVVSAEYPAQDFLWRTYSHLLLAEAYYRLEKYEEASRHYEQAAKHPTLTSQARLYLAWSRYHA